MSDAEACAAVRCDGTLQSGVCANASCYSFNLIGGLALADILDQFGVSKFALQRNSQEAGMGP